MIRVSVFDDARLITDFELNSFVTADFLNAIKSREVASLKLAISENTKTIAHLRTECDRKDKTIADRIYDIGVIREEKKSAIAELTSQEPIINALRRTCDDQMLEITALKHGLSECQSRTASALSLVDKESSLVAEKDRTIAELRASVASMDETIRKRDDSVSSLSDTIAALRPQLDLCGEMEETIKSRDGRIVELAARNEAASDVIKDKDVTIKACVEARKSAEFQVSELRRRLQATQSFLDAKIRDVDFLHRQFPDIKNLQQASEAIHKNLSQLDSEIGRLFSLAVDLSKADSE